MDNAVDSTASAAPVAVTVVGIGEDGWDGLGGAARAALRDAALIVGSARQLALLPGSGDLPVPRAPLPAPLLEHLDSLVRDHPGLCLLASGDPMLYGIGATLARRLPPGRLRVLPAPSSVALACARLGWPEQDTEVISLVAAPPAAALAGLAPGDRLIVLCRDGGTPGAVAGLLTGAGWGDSEVTVLERLGGPAERVRGPWRAADLAAGETVPEGPGPGGAGSGRTGPRNADPGNADPGNTGPSSTGPGGTGPGGTGPGSTGLDATGLDAGGLDAGGLDAGGLDAGALGGFADLCVLGVLARPGAGVVAAGRLPGLADEAFENDGQVTRRELRVLALAALRPGPGDLLWDVGAGSGSIGIEWLRAQPGALAVAIEARADRAERARRNAAGLGVPGLRVVHGRAPAALAELPAPDAVFVGGGLTAPGLLAACWAALAPGGRLVAHAVTVESEAVLHQWYREHGGSLTRTAISYVEPLGGFTTWRPALPVVQWQVSRA